jgi:hypothetical protein
MRLGPWVSGRHEKCYFFGRQVGTVQMIYGKYYRQVLQWERDGSQDQESNNFFAEFPADVATVYTLCGWGRGGGSTAVATHMDVVRELEGRGPHFEFLFHFSSPFSLFFFQKRLFFFNMKFLDRFLQRHM